MSRQIGETYRARSEGCGHSASMPYFVEAGGASWHINVFTNQEAPLGLSVQSSY